jgi:hypothetical protein
MNQHKMPFETSFFSDQNCYVSIMQSQSQKRPASWTPEEAHPPTKKQSLCLLSHTKNEETDTAHPDRLVVPRPEWLPEVRQNCDGLSAYETGLGSLWCETA